MSRSKPWARAGLALTVVAAVSTVTALEHAPAFAEHPLAVDGKNVSIDVHAIDVVYDPLREVLYAITASTDPVFPSRLLRIDPDTVDVESVMTLGGEPSRLVIAADASALHIAVDNIVSKFSLPDLTMAWSHLLGSPGADTAWDVAVSPASADTIAVSVKHTGGGLGPGTVVIDHGVRRPDTSDPADSGLLAFDSAGARLFVLTSSLIEYDVGPTGLSSPATVGPNLGQRMTVEGDRLRSGGQIFDISGPLPSLSVDLTGLDVSALAHDPLRHEMIGLASSPRRAGSADLVVMDDTSFAVKAVWEATAATNSPSGNPVVWAGPGRVAFRDTGYLTAAAPIVLAWLDPDAGFGSQGEYHPLSPTRILDTRNGLGFPGGSRRVGAGETIELQVAGRGGTPAEHVEAIVMNVTAVAPTAAGYLTVYPSDIERPTISNLNFQPGITVANLVTTPVSPAGTVSIYNPYGDIDVLADVAGYYSTDAGPDGLRFEAYQQPQRIVDTRAGRNTLTPRSTLTYMFGRDLVSGLHPDVEAVALNITITNATAPSFVSVYPADVPLPTVSKRQLHRRADACESGDRQTLRRRRVPDLQRGRQR